MPKYQLDPENARSHPPENSALVATSLKTLGGGRSILIDGDGVVRAGNKTYETALALGMEIIEVETTPNQLVAVKRADLKGPDAVRMGLMDNQATDTSHFDGEVLLKLAERYGEDVVKAGVFEEDEWRELVKHLGEEKGEDAGPQVDRAEELQEKWKVESGDVWQLGEHRIVCGDCTDAATVARVIESGTAKLVFTDPPYGVGIGQKNIFLNSFQKAGRNLSDIAGDLMGKDELLDMLVKAFTIVREVMDDCAAIYVTAPQGGELGLMMMMMMMMMSGLPVRHVLNWVKNAPTFSLGRLDYDYQHEPILYTWKKTHVHYGKGPHTKSVWFIDKPREAKEHPTMKPVALYENALLNSSIEGDLVYEPFLGSGTSVIACENLGRRCRGVELAPKYVAVTLERWATLTGKMPVLLERGA